MAEEIGKAQHCKCMTTHVGYTLMSVEGQPPICTNSTHVGCGILLKEEAEKIFEVIFKDI